MQTYLLHSGLILAFLSIFYWLLLRQETFFKANRWLLLGNIIMALIIPLLPTPEPIIQLKTELVESFKPMEKIEKPVISLEKSADGSSSGSGSGSGSTSGSSGESIPLIETIKPTFEPTNITSAKHPPITWSEILKWGYIIGFSIMLFRFLIQLFSVRLQINQSKITKGIGYYLAINNKDIAPFSFWKYIIINPNKYDETSFLQILDHERIHIIQRHTIDLVLAELFLIVQWFNPLAWWHRYLIGQNLEFLVDQTLLDNGENKQAYQYHLVQVAVPNSPLSISSNYNASQLKNRIKMMNLQRSSLAASWKYALLLPISFILLMAFSPQATFLNNEQITSLDALYIVITEDAKISEIKETQEKLLVHGVNLIFENLVYNTDNKIESLEVALKVDNTFGMATWPKEKKGFQSLILYKNWKSQDLGTGYVSELFEVIENRPENSEVFVIGGENTPSNITMVREDFRREI